MSAKSRRQEWTRDEDDRLRELYNAGNLTNQQIADALGRSPRSVLCHRSRLGLVVAWSRAVTVRNPVMRIMEARFNGKTPHQISQSLGISLDRVRRTIKANDKAAGFDCNDGPLVAQLLAEGGMPRIVLLPAGPVWVGPSGEPWRGWSLAA